ncbi:MAG: hypothetical protein JWN76_3698 [Chitinophagaceae bacterium]|nr:hypothetical protein [Chitinophagaceae bacterium]
MNPSVQLYSVYYKPFPIYPKAAYVTCIQAGKGTAKIKMDIPGDDTGDNISSMNDLYSELTAAYWIIKNAARNTDAFGLCHYRRYLIQTRHKLLFKKRSKFPFRTKQEQLDKLLTPALYKAYQQLLSTHDVIVQRPTWARKEKGIINNIRDAYTADHIKEDYDITMQVVSEKYPEYISSIEQLDQQVKMFYNNVMIARWQVWDGYLSWLFDILFEVQKRIELPKQGYQTRVFGFLAERLHNLYVLHNKLNAAYLTLGLFEDQL